ncbi:MAG: hypothetical protein E6J05_12590 [Chloroflexi bacterium]|nr:MAG: hypothetical protein E6J05_12590 [Chloroflexota bacterium]
MERPVRRPREDCRRRRHRQAEWTGCGLAKGVHEGPVGLVGLDAGHLLPENHRHQRFEDRTRLGQAQARMAAERLGDERMERAKPGVVILFAAKLRCTRRGPAGSGSPPLDFDLAVFLHEVDGGGTLRRESRPPDFAIAHTQ